MCVYACSMGVSELFPTSSPQSFLVPPSPGYIFRVNPYREMVSDMVRYTRLPFCGLRPFMRMVADIAKNALQAGCANNAAFSGDAETCKFTFVEGGSRGICIVGCFFGCFTTLRVLWMRFVLEAHTWVTVHCGHLRASVSLRKSAIYVLVAGDST